MRSLNVVKSHHLKILRLLTPALFYWLALFLNCVATAVGQAQVLFPSEFVMSFNREPSSVDREYERSALRVVAILY